MKKVKIYKYENLYQLQFKARELMKKRSSTNISKAIKIHTNILKLIKNYEDLNKFDQALTKTMKLQNKLELREIKLSSILLRMKANKKCQNYVSAYQDSMKLWSLMSPSERITNKHFQGEYVNELRILSAHSTSSEQKL